MTSWQNATRSWRRIAAALLLSLAASLPGLCLEPTPIAPGAAYWHEYEPEGPWAVNAVTVDLSQDMVELHTLLGRGDTTGRQVVPDMLAAESTEERRGVAAVNGDYFALAGQGYTTLPLGFSVRQGEIITLPDPSRSVLYLLKDGSAHIGRFRANCWVLGPEGLMFPLSGVNRPPAKGDLTLLTPRFGEKTITGDTARQLTLTDLSGPLRPNTEVTARISQVAIGGSRPIPPDGAVLVASGVASYALRRLKPGDEITIRLIIEPNVGEIEEAIGGGPRLVRDGKISVEYRRERFSEKFALTRHPRTGVGVADGALVMVTVDGRQPGYSEGMTLQEFAQLFVDIGCRDAMNLDGGGSTTMVVRDRVVNSPSDGAPRRVANGLGLFTTAPKTGKPVTLAIEPGEANVLAGEEVKLSAVGLDEYYNRIRPEPGTVRWECPPFMGEVDENGVFRGAPVGEPVVGLVVARCGDLTASCVVRVLPAATRLTITPSHVVLKPGATQKFAARAFDADNKPVYLPPSRITWEVSPPAAGARIDAHGVLRAPARDARVSVIARAAGLEARAEVLVGTISTVIEDFEQPRAYRATATPAGARAEAAVAADPLQPGNRCLRLDYDFSTPTGTRVAKVTLDLPLPESRTLSARVIGDGQGAWLRARLRDAADRTFTVDLADRLDWSGEWRKVTGWLPEDIAQPAVLEAIYVTEYHDDRHPKGRLYLDDIGAGGLGTRPADAEGDEKNKAGARQPRDMPADEKEEKQMSELPSYVCLKTPEPITIDGQLDEPVWSRVEPITLTLNDGSGEPQLPTELRACWDDDNLYLAYTVVDTDIWGTYRKRDDLIWEEEVVEAFLSSCGDATKYFEFNFSPHNVVFDAKIEIPENGDRTHMKSSVAWNCEGLRSAVKVVGTLDRRDDLDERWTVEAALPFSEIGRKGKAPTEGETWRANFYRIDRAGEGEFSAWSPTLVGNYHVPARFGRLVFSERLL